MKLTKIFFTGVTVGMLALSGCNKWVDLPPKDRLTQHVLFSTKEGYLKALNGIYADLASTQLYGRDLSMGTLDVMAQYYNTGVGEHLMLPYATFDYASDNFKGKLNTIWSRFYTLIANANAILDQCDNHNGVLPGVYYGMVKGETLALRAMLHFDLLRMYGPIYEKDKTKKCIPYIESSDRSIQPLLSAEEILQKVLKDLKEAQQLLGEADPVRTLGPQNFPGEEKNDMNYRQYRLNYFAVTALLARAYLWGGMDSEALSAAQSVIAEVQKTNNPLFPFSTLEEIKPSVANRAADRVFSKEVLFAGYQQQRVSSYNALFSPSLSATSILTLAGTLTNGRLQLLYDNPNDYRRAMWATASMNDNKEVYYFNKFEDLSDDSGNANAFRYMVPLIRIGELFLIVAECATDLTVAKEALNSLRLHRGIPALDFNSKEEMRSTIEGEYMRELMGEGQLFFFFKRKAYTELPNGNRPEGGVIPMNLPNYVFPLPESETSQRN